MATKDADYPTLYEYCAAAEWCAARGIDGKPGDELPPLLSTRAAKLIADNPDDFQHTVAMAAYAQAMLRHKLPAEQEM